MVPVFDCIVSWEKHNQTLARDEWRHYFSTHYKAHLEMSQMYSRSTNNVTDKFSYTHLSGLHCSSILNTDEMSSCLLTVLALVGGSRISSSHSALVHVNSRVTNTLFAYINEQLSLPAVQPPRPCYGPVWAIISAVNMPIGDHRNTLSQLPSWSRKCPWNKTRRN